MRFIIYVDNVQQYMRVLQRKFVKLHRVYPKLLYILKIFNTLRLMLIAINNF